MANKNGGPDNITAIVARVIEVGTAVDAPPARYPVPAGVHEADVDTAILGSIPSSGSGASLSRPADSVQWGGDRSFTSATFSSLDDLAEISSPTAHLVAHKQRRLFYPTLSLIVLLLITLLGGGSYYYFIFLNGATNHLAQARMFIDRANEEFVENPVDAIQQLSQAQNALFAAQGPLLVGDSASQYMALQADLRTTLQKATTSYNHQELITQLPCSASHSVRLAGSVSATTLTTIQDDKGAPVSYILGNDHNIYQLDSQDHFVPLHLSTTNIHFMQLVGSGQHLFALTSQADNASNFTISMLSFATTATSSNVDFIAIPADIIKSGWSPTFLTAYNSDIFLVLTSNTSPNQAQFLYYDANNWHNVVHSAQISVSSSIVSVAAFPNRQIFLTTSDGQVKVLPFGNGGNSLQTEPVILQNSARPPLAIDPSNFTFSTPVATPLPQPTPVSNHSFLSVPHLSFLAVGSSTASGLPHLYIVDNTYHRVLAFAFTPGSAVNVPQTTLTPGVTPTPAPKATSTGSPVPIPTPSTGSGAFNSPSLQLIQQFASPTILASMTGAAISLDGKQLSLLTQGGSTLTSITSLDQVPACSPSA